MAERGIALALALASLGLLLSLTASSVLAQVDQGTVPVQNDPNPCSTINEKVLPGACDTEYTPIAKDSANLWARVAGVPFGKTEAPESSFTPASVDLYTVDFLNQSEGYAAGAACSEDTPFEELDECTRVPVIWAYTDREAEGPLWREVYRGDSQGFVAALSAYDHGKALAVGGTGGYPYREFSNDTTTDPGSDPSGKGAVWELDAQRYGDSEWHQYGPSQLPTAPNLAPKTPGADDLISGDVSLQRSVPTPMRALSALDCKLDPVEGALCVAGGIQQLFMWSKGSFQKSYGNGSRDDDLPVNHNGLGLGPGLGGTPKPTTEMSAAQDFRFRVRSLSFVPGDAPYISVIGATSGCCDPTATDVARLLLYDNKRWYVRPLQRTQAGEKLRQTYPDSYYAVEAYASGSFIYASVVATSGGPEQALELGSQVVGSRLVPQQNGTGLDDFEWALSGGGSLTSVKLSEMRLVAGGRDIAGGGFLQLASSTPSPGADLTIDWAVGERPATGQGVAYTTTTIPQATTAPPIVASEAAAPCFRGVGSGSSTTVPDPAQCEAGDTADIEEAIRSRSLLLVDSYRLNGFGAVGRSGEAWAVGDRGAIVHLGGRGSLAAGLEPRPPRLEGRRPSPSTGIEAYGAGASVLSEDPGTVPALSTRTETAARPQLVNYGSPDTDRSGFLKRDDVVSIVASRDGSEAWALGSGHDVIAAPTPTMGRTTLYHFTGTSWTPCDVQGVRGEIAPDPACAGLLPLTRYANANNVAEPVRIAAAARVPLENDADPRNDDRFEAVAVGSPYRPNPSEPQRCSVLRYESGEWLVDLEAMREIDPVGSLGANGTRCFTDIAFSSPSEGWALAYEGDIFHFDGAHWVNCTNASAACGVAASASPLPPKRDGGAAATLHLASVGERVYLFGARQVRDLGNLLTAGSYPLILYKDPNGHWTDGSRPGEDGAGYDPGCASLSQGGACAPAADAGGGQIDALSVVRGGDGRLSGWASGLIDNGLASAAGKAGAMLQLGSDASSGRYRWRPWSADDATADYPSRLYARDAGTSAPRLLALPGQEGAGEALLLPTSRDASSDGPLLRFDPANGRWVAHRTPFTLPETFHLSGRLGDAARLRAIAPDNQGGAWIAVRRMGGESGSGHGFRAGATFLYRYTDQVPRPIFSDVPNPVRAGEVVSTAAGAGDGSFWLATESSAVYRYDRITGWQRFDIPGWDPGRIVTRHSKAYAIATGGNGLGLVVGERGRIADLSPQGVVLDPAAGVSCSTSPPPCGTGRDLHAAAVAPDGSALVGGDARTLLWRPPGGDLRAVSPPPADLAATITAISMPTSDRAWLATHSGQVFAGAYAAGDWRWRLENVSPDGTVLSTGIEGKNGADGEPVAINAIAVNSEGFGFAVGDQGLVLERAGDGPHPWRRLGDLPLQSYRSVALPTTGSGEGALIGGQYGSVLTLQDGQLQAANEIDAWDPVAHTESDSLDPSRSSVVGVALIPGVDPGQIEAWAVEQSSTGAEGRQPAPNAILHYSADDVDPLLDGGANRVAPLPDLPPPPPGSVSLAAFGKSECQEASRDTCVEPTGSNLANERIAAGIADRLTGPNGPDLAIFTGDAVDAAGADAPTDGGGAEGDVVTGRGTALPSSPIDPSVTHSRWIDSVASRFSDAGVPLLGALGGKDLSRTISESQLPVNQSRLGTAVPWQKAMAEMPAPWGTGDPYPQRNGLSFEPVADPGLVDVGTERTQAATHYALDVVRDEEPLVRIVVIDTALRSLAAGAGGENPLEDQTSWLRSVLCRKGEETGEASRCTRAPGERAIVVTNSPTYTYGPGADQTATDAAAIEALLFKYHVDLVVAGRLGWNGLYYTLEAGLHSPQLGGAYPDRRPTSVRADGQVIPTVIAASAGGAFAPDAQDPAAEGFWHGYSEISLDPQSGEVSVAQRPILDWVRIEARTHTVGPRAKLRLRGIGRETPGMDQPLRYDEITSPAITHRYDLVLADPERPWLPLPAAAASPAQLSAAAGYGAPSETGASNPCEPYVCLDPEIGAVDRQTGEVRAGDGKHPETFALALLSVGDRSAAYPLVFEKAPSFVVKSVLRVPGVPPVNNQPTPKPPGQPPLPEPPTIPKVDIPQIPEPPAIPLADAAAPPEPQPPAPPAPPPPANQPAALDLTVAPPGISISTPTALIQPPTPPVNPAPPGGARREARQRQAAAQKGGADADESAGDASELGGDMADGRDGAHGSAMTRRAEPGPARQDYSFTRLERGEGPNAVAWGGGLTLAALVLALSFSTLRPGPRRREPELPAPAWNRRRSG